jgi:lysophospholipase L1-like esterase
MEPNKAGPLSPKYIWLFRLAAIALGVTCALMLLEISVRLILARRPNDIEALRRLEEVMRTQGELKLKHFVRMSHNPKMVYEMVPNVSGTFHDAPLRTNSAGFADRERTLKKSDGVFRIAVIGDSIAFGWGVAPEDRYSNLLEKFLNDTGTSHPTYEVLNFGIPGYNTVMEAALLRDRVLAYEPDALVLGYCDNDTSLPNFIRKPRDLLTLRHSYLWDILRERSVKSARTALEGAVQYSDYTNIPDEYKCLIGWENARKAFDNIAKATKERKIKVLHLPYYYDFESYRYLPLPPRNDNCDIANAIAQQLGFVIVNPLQAAIQFLSRHRLHAYALWVKPPEDAHPNKILHAIMARELYRAMVEHNILPDSASRAAQLPQHLAFWDKIIEDALVHTQIAPEYKNYTPSPR